MSLFDFFRRKKVEMMPPGDLLYTVVDITETFGDNLSLGKEDWVTTTPLIKLLGVDNYEGLPSVDASAGEIYAIAVGLSEIREEFQSRTDGVYCPVCHIANVDKEKLRKPCPNCGRELLLFDWN